MLDDILDDQLQWHPKCIYIIPIVDSVTELDLITEFDFLPNCAGFP